MSSKQFDFDPGGKNNQKESLTSMDEDDDVLISQAYDEMMKTSPLVSTSDMNLTCGEIILEETLLSLEDLLGKPPSPTCLNLPDLPDLDSINSIIINAKENSEPKATVSSIDPEGVNEEEIIIIEIYDEKPADSIGFNEGDIIFFENNEETSEVKSLKELALAATMNHIHKQPNNEPSDTSSIIATILLMDIFDKACNLAKQPKRWKKADPASWKINVAKKRRAEGIPYVSKNKIRPAKIPQPVDCSKCRYDCSNKLDEELRKQTCRMYWNLDFVSQKNYILTRVNIKQPKTMSLDRKRATKRSYSTECSFNVKDQKVNVCQKFFCKTLCISQSVLRNAVKNRDDVGQFSKMYDIRGNHEPANKTPPEKLEEVREHIKSFPTMESHYIRKYSKRCYLDCKLSIRKMYQLYVEDCDTRKSQPVSEITYRRIFGNEFNLGFFKPKKDQCLICTKYTREENKKDEKLGLEFNEHIARKKSCNNEKEKDKKRAGSEKEFVSVSFDLQAILQIPSGDIGLLYYTRKLTVYNLTVYESALPNDAYCFTWSELNGKKGSCEIGTILYHYLTKCVPNYVTEVSLFSDTCGGQNRNKNVAAILLWAVNTMKNLAIIEQKFLESGHSYMEADSMHSSIETAQKNTSIYSMIDWINIFKRARSKITYKKDKKKVVKALYQVKEFKYYEFKDLKDLSEKILLNTKKDTDGKQVKWLKIKRLRYVKGESKIYYNYDMSEKFSVIDVTAIFGRNESSSTQSAPEKQKEHGYQTRNKKKLRNNVSQNTDPLPVTAATSYFPESLRQLYQAPLKISAAKKKDLMQLCTKGVIPEEFHGWVQSLNADATTKDRVPDCTVSDTDCSSEED